MELLQCSSTSTHLHPIPSINRHFSKPTSFLCQNPSKISLGFPKNFSSLRSTKNADYLPLESPPFIPVYPSGFGGSPRTAIHPYFQSTTSNQLADIFTKALSGPHFRLLLSKLGLTGSPSSPSLRGGNGSPNSVAASQHNDTTSQSEYVAALSHHQEGDEIIHITKVLEDLLLNQSSQAAIHYSPSRNM